MDGVFLGGCLVFAGFLTSTLVDARIGSSAVVFGALIVAVSEFRFRLWISRPVRFCNRCRVSSQPLQRGPNRCCCANCGADIDSTQSILIQLEQPDR